MNNVILYHQDGCSQCQMAILLLNRANIPFTSCKDVNVMKEKGITSPPVLQDGTLFCKGVKAINEWIRMRK